MTYDISSFQDCQGAFWLWNGWYSHFTHFQLFNCVQLFNRFLQHNFTDKVKICLNIIKITTAFLWEKFSATHCCWSSWASSSSVCQTLSMMSQGLPRLAKREDGTWRKTGNIIFPSGLEIFSAKNGNAWEKKNRKYCFSSDLKIFPAKKQNKRYEEVLTKNLNICGQKQGIYHFHQAFFNQSWKKSLRVCHSFLKLQYFLLYI